MNRGVSLSVVLALMGCSGRAAQPIVVDREALIGSSEERIEVVVEEGEEREPASLAAPSELDGLIAVQPGDLMTATSRSSPSIVVGPGAEPSARSLREAGRVRLVTYPEGDEVPFEWADGSEGYGGVTRHHLLVPSRPLEPRWYAIELRVDDAVAGAVREGDVQVSRFRPDSHPVLQGVAVASRDGQHLVEARFSERVQSDIPASDWSLEDDAGRVPCTVEGPGPGWDAMRALWTCERPVLGHVRIDFGGALATVHGHPLRDVDGEALTRVSVGRVAIRESEGVTLLR